MRALVWLLALPIRNLAVIAVDLRGPAHFHADAQAPESNKRASFNAFDVLTQALVSEFASTPASAFSRGSVRKLVQPFPGRLDRPPTPAAAGLSG